MRTAAYAPIDVHSSKPIEGGLWPSSIPPLTAEEATRAVRRLWRFSLGEKMRGDVTITSGNRRATRLVWTPTGSGSTRGLAVNPSKGWRELIHDLSHDLDYLANGETQHGKHHARFEAKLVREVVRRGWLDGKLRDAPAEPAVRLAPTLDERRRAKLSRIEARIVAWERKQRRAEKALAKLAKSRRYYERALAGSES